MFILWRSVCLPIFMKFRLCLFKILKKQNVADGRTDVLMRVQLRVAPRTSAPQIVVRYWHTRTDSICEVFSLYKCSLYTLPHMLRPTMDTLSELVQTNTFQTWGAAYKCKFPHKWWLYSQRNSQIPSHESGRTDERTDGQRENSIHPPHKHSLQGV